jgi:hypothetical protein
MILGSLYLIDQKWSRFSFLPTYALRPENDPFLVLSIRMRASSFRDVQGILFVSFNLLVRSHLKTPS